MAAENPPTSWLVLVYQFPAGPGSARVKVWRRLQTLGAIAIKNSMYVLPPGEQSQEDFQWLLRELVASGAEAAVLESRFVDGMSDVQVRGLFDAARDGDYGALLGEIESAEADLDAAPQHEEDVSLQARRLVQRARRRLAEIEAIDFFGAPGRLPVEIALRALSERVLRETGESEAAPETVAELREYQGRTWVTRCNVGIDRIACAWLIRRWIDAAAEFRFVAGPSDQPAEDEIRFDMFEGEFTHRGERCTAEVLAQQFRPDDSALAAVAEIVHDIDIKDAKYQRPQTQGVASMLAGIASRFASDEERLERGAAMLDDLYHFFLGEQS